jgi:hypothetical protein
MMWKWLAFVLLLVLVLSNGVWLYLALDWASGEKYRQMESYERQNQVNALRDLSNHFVTGSTKTELSETLALVFPDHEPFEKDGAIHAMWLSFPTTPEGLVQAVNVSP